MTRARAFVDSLGRNGIRYWGGRVWCLVKVVVIGYSDFIEK